MQGQLNNVSHTPPHVVSFFCLCRSALLYCQYRHAGSPHEASVPALISHLKRISCYKPIVACGGEKKKGAYFLLMRIPSNPHRLLFSAQPGEVCAAGWSVPFAPQYFLIMFLVHPWPRRFPISFSHFESGEYNMIVAHMRGSADSGSVQRTQIAFPLEDAPAVLKALEGMLGTCHQRR